MLLQGGSFLYPTNSKNKEGRLRLVYEAYPMAYIIMSAGGIAIDGEKEILDVYQKVSVYMFGQEEFELFGIS